MNLKRKIEVVMLATDKQSAISINKNGKMFLNSYSDTTNYHIYFLSDEVVKELDLFLVLNEVFKCHEISLKGVRTLKNGKEYFFDPIECKKIIVTTDKVLNLPEPSPQFIQKYIEEWNKGNKIQWVMVDYEVLDIVVENGKEYAINSILKVDKNNQVTTTKVKDSWNREEIEDIIDSVLRTYRHDYLPLGAYPDYTILECKKKFIEENL